MTCEHETKVYGGLLIILPSAISWGPDRVKFRIVWHVERETGFHPCPLGAGSTRPNLKKGASETEILYA